jgi:hypothetical protein
MTTTPEPGPTVGGATGPIESADPPWGAQAPGGNPAEAPVGPAHHTGTFLEEDADDDYEELGGEG